MRYALAVMGGLVAAGTIYIAAFGNLPDDLGLVLTGAAIVLASVFVMARLEDER